jgi:hypothetical protein
VTDAVLLVLGDDERQTWAKATLQAKATRRKKATETTTMLTIRDFMADQLSFG